MKSKLPHEVFALVKAARGIPKRAKILQENANFELKTILQASFRDDIVFDLPEGAPPYKVSEVPAGMERQHISKTIGILSRLIVNFRGMSRTQKEMKFIGLLETSHAEDAKILIAMKDKTLHKLWPQITKELAKEAFPNLF